MTIKKVELEIEYARLVYRMDGYTDQKKHLERQIKELQQDLELCEEEINRLGIALMTTSIKLAKTRGKT